MRRFRRGRIEPRGGVDRQDRRARPHAAALASAPRRPPAPGGWPVPASPRRSGRRAPPTGRAARRRAAPGGRWRRWGSTRRRGRRASRSARAPAPRVWAITDSPSVASALIASWAGAVETTSSPARAVVRVDPLGLAPCPDRVDGLARGAHPGVAGRAVVARAARRRPGPWARRSRRCARSARARTARSRARRRARRVGVEHVPRRPHPRVAAADDDHVGPESPSSGGSTGGAAGVRDPEAVRVVQHERGQTPFRSCAATAAATASRSTSRSPPGTSAPIGSAAKIGSRPASPSRMARLAERQVHAASSRPRA